MLFPHALEKELAELLTVVTRRKQVKGQDNLEQQISELKEVFAVYDDDQTGELEQAEFVEALMSAGLQLLKLWCFATKTTVMYHTVDAYKLLVV